MVELENMDPERLASAALQSFFNITNSWGLTTNQQQTLLGMPEEFNRWKSEKSAKSLDEDTLVRVSYILGIYKALKIMHVEENGRLFIHNATEATPFNGRSPLDLMLSGDLQVVHRYLDAQLQSPYT